MSVEKRGNHKIKKHEKVLSHTFKKILIRGVGDGTCGHYPYGYQSILSKPKLELKDYYEWV